MSKLSISDSGDPAQSDANELVRRGVTRAAEARKAVTREVQQRIVGQHQVLDLMLIGLVSRGHCLLVGVPGLAKTLVVQTLAQVLELKFSRIQLSTSATSVSLSADWEVPGTWIRNSRPPSTCRNRPTSCLRAGTLPAVPAPSTRWQP